MWFGSKPKVFKNLWAKEAAANSVARPMCQCLNPQYDASKWSELELHTEEQDTAVPGWARLLELIEAAARDGRQEFSPGREMPPDQWAQITTLPASIAKLKEVKHLILYGSSLVRIPPEIGEMSNLEEFTPYTSYRLHWFPYEITKCRKLKKSTVSTRALYGNFKFRAPFPRLPQIHSGIMPDKCSVCGSLIGGEAPMQYWVSLKVATDVLPLLIHSCSEKCLSKVSNTPKGYVKGLHQGGLQLMQPPDQD